MVKMTRTRNRSALVSVSLFATLVLAACTTAASPAPSPSAPSSPPPSVEPSPRPSAQPSPDPSVPPVDGYIRLDLDIATDHDVKVAIEDKTGTLVNAVSGRAGDGMSTRWFESIVENVDDHTIRLTWVGLPMDDEVLLGITLSNGIYHLQLVQGAPPANSDAIGFDRVVVLDFDKPVSADDFEATIQEGRDTDD
jgi:hypothetical protein